jgi:hypothetical protein
MGDMASINGLLSKADSIQRKINYLPNGTETVTASDDPEAAGFLSEGDLGPTMSHHTCRKVATAASVKARTE